MECFDRNTIFSQIINSNKQLIFLRNCKSNGITTFCRCKFKDRDTIYLTEDSDGKIKCAYSTFEKYNSEVGKMEKFEINLNRIKLISPLLAGFLYLLPTSINFFGINVPSNGTFFANLAKDSSNLIIEGVLNRKIKTFCELLKKALSEGNSKKVYLIVEHASNMSENFIREIKNVLTENIQAVCILCFDDSNIPQEYKNNFLENDYDCFAFGFPSLEEGGLSILEGEHIEITKNVKIMYLRSSNYKEFKNKYYKSIHKKIERKQMINLIIKYLCVFGHNKLTKNDLYLILEFINQGNFIDNSINVDETIKELIDCRFLSEDLENNCYEILNYEKLDFEKSKAFSLSFLEYLPNVAENNIVSYRLFKSIFQNTENIEFISEETIAEYIDEILVEKDTELKDLFLSKLQNKSFKKYNEWKKIYISLFNYKFYSFIPKCEETKNNNCLFLIKLAKSHELFDKDIANDISDKIEDCKNINQKVLLYIVLYDYYDTHNQKESSNLINAIKSNENLKESFYYKYLLLLIAEKENDWSKMINMFDESINNLTYKEQFRAINSKFAFCMMRYVDGKKNDKNKEEYIAEIAKKLQTHECFTINDTFVLNNFLVFKYMFGVNLLGNDSINYNKIFKIDNHSTQTHHYLLNKAIYDSIIKKNIKYFNFNFFIKFDDEFNKQSRINSFIYNYYVVARYLRKKLATNKARKIIHNNKNFQNYRNYSNFVKIEGMKSDEIKKNVNFLIKYGFMVHRTLDIKYLVEELDK